MSLLVVGSVAFDSVETPTAKRDNVVGGSATFFSYAAGYFTPVSLVAEVGEDWPAEHTKLLETQQINTTGLRVVPGAKSEAETWWACRRTRVAWLAVGSEVTARPPERRTRCMSADFAADSRSIAPVELHGFSDGLY